MFPRVISQEGHGAWSGTAFAVPPACGKAFSRAATSHASFRHNRIEFRGSRFFPKRVLKHRSSAEAHRLAPAQGDDDYDERGVSGFLLGAVNFTAIPVR
jgi:hypothetical protein